MARDLKLQVILDAADKASRPLKAIERASQNAAQAMKDNRDRLRQLQAVQKNVSSFRTLKNQSGETAKALREQQDRIRRLSQQMQSHEGDTASLVAERKKAIDQARRLSQRHDDERRELQRLRSSLNENGISTSNLRRDQQHLANEMQEASQAVEEQRRKLKRLAEQQKHAAQARRRYDRSVSRAGNMAGAGAAGLATGGGALYAGTRMLAPGVEFGEAMSRVQALTRLDKEDERFKALREQARELGSTTAFSAGQAANAQGFLAMAGFSPDAIQASMADMLNLALANGTDLARTADISSNILSGFGLDPAEMGRVGDVLTATTTRANVDLEMLGDSMKYVAPVAREMGLSLEEAAAMSGLLGNVGIQGSQAGTTLRAMMTRLAAPTGKASSAIQALGINIKDAEGNMRNVPQILSDVAKVTENLGNAERMEHLKAIFGEEPAAGMAELINQQGAAGIEGFTEILTQAAGENARVAKTMADNIGGDLKSLNSAWQEIGITLTDTNKGPLRRLIQSITGITRAVGNWMKANPELTGTLAIAAAALATLVAIGGGFMVLLGSVIGPIAMVNYALTLLSMNPVSLTIMGIVAAVAALAAGAYLVYRNWDSISAWFGERWNDIKVAFSGGIGSVMRLLANWSPLGLLWRGISSALSALGMRLPTTLTGLGSAIIDGLIHGIDAGWQALRSKITSMASSVGNWFKEVLGIHSPSRVFAGFGGNLIQGLVNGIDERWQSLKDAIGGTAEAVVGWFKEKLGIHSPSRVFAELGGFTMDGYRQGLQREEDAPLRQIGQFGDRLKRAGAGLAIGAASLPTAAMPAIAPQEPIRFDTRPPLSRAEPQAQGGLSVGDINIEVNAAPGMDKRQIGQIVAQEVQRALAEQRDQLNARRRSSMWDTE